jgi:hypothetical protein
MRAWCDIATGCDTKRLQRQQIGSATVLPTLSPRFIDAGFRLLAALLGQARNCDAGREATSSTAAIVAARNPDHTELSLIPVSQPKGAVH